MGDDHDDKLDTYIKFADIVQHYDDVARPAHDDIEFSSADLDDLDGGEYDYDGRPVEQYGVIFIVLFAEQYDSSEDDDYDYDQLNPSKWIDNDYIHNRLRWGCDRPRGFKFGAEYRDSEEPSDDE